MPATRGSDWRFQVFIAGSPTTLAGERGCTLNTEAASIDTTSKDQNAWGQALPGIRSWSIDVDGLIITDDAAYQALLDAYKATPPTRLEVQIVRPDSKVWRGYAYLTNFSHEMPHDGVVTGPFSFTGDGEPTKLWEP